MTRPDYTHLTIIMDRSGSMADVRSDAQGAINHFLDEQKEVPGDCSLLFIDFDSTDAQQIVHDGPLAEMGKYMLRPRNSTPLLYAVGKAIDNTGTRLDAMAEDNRPGKVIFVIQTDGLENHSHLMPEHPYTWDHVREMIKTQTEAYGWQVIFLGMGSDSWGQGERLGVQNVVRSSGAGAAHASTYDTMSTMSTAYRGGTVNDMSGIRGMHVNDDGTVTNEAGEEIDPKTGKPRDTSGVS